MNSRETGKLGEAYTEKFLTSQNYKILMKNYHSRFGELDMIALDYNNKPLQLVFIEVKTRTSIQFGEPQESVTIKKMSKILKTIFHFFQKNKKWLTPCWRIDVIALKLDVSLKVKEIQHFKNISNGY